MRKLVAIALLLVTFTGLSSASSHVSANDQTLTYGWYSQSDEPKVYCDDSSGSCPEDALGNYNYWLQYPASETETARYQPNSGLDASNYNPYEDEGVPGDLALGYGTHQLGRMVVENCGVSGCTTLLDEDLSAEITVPAQNMEPHHAKFLFAEVDVNVNKFRDLMLTNDSNGEFTSRYPAPISRSVHNFRDDAAILVLETDWQSADGQDDPGIFVPEEGVIIEPGDNQLLKSSDMKASARLDRNGAFVNEDNLDSEDVRKQAFQSSFYMNPGEGDADSAGGAYGCDTFIWGFDECSPVHRINKYNLEGPIINGYFPEYYVTDSSGTSPGADSDPNNEDEQFFICREGAEMVSDQLNGVTTGFVVDSTDTTTNEDLMKCEWDVTITGEPYNFRWESVNECEDGLDNDGDGNIDVSEDPACDSSSDSEDWEATKNLIVPFKKDFGDSLAYYDFSDDTIYRVMYSGLSQVGGVGDIDGDFDQDIAFTEGSSSPYNLEYYDLGQDTLDSSSVSDTNTDVYKAGPLMDLDSDSAEEVLVVIDSTDMDLGYYDDATGTVKFIADGNFQSLYHPGDLDGDTEPEIPYIDSSNSLRYYDFESNSTTNLPENSLSAGGADDVDGDGNIEMPIKTTGGNGYIWEASTDTFESPFGSTDAIAGMKNLDTDTEKEVIFSGQDSSGSGPGYLQVYDPSTGTAVNLSKNIGHLGIVDFSDWVSVNCATKDPVVGDYKYPTVCGAFGCAYNTEKAAFWNQSSTGVYRDERTGCYYNDVDVNSTLENSPPSTFTCAKDDSINNVALFDSEKRGFCNSISDWKFDDHNSSYQEAVEYHVPKDAIPYGKNQFVEWGGWDNDAFQTLHGSWSLTSKSGGAETTYDQPGSFDDFGCDSCHDNATWAAKNMTNLNGYETGTVADYSDAWGVANASGFVNPDVAATPGLINNSDTFAGGFYGKCPAGKIWMYVKSDNEWKCSGSIPWDHQAMAPDIQNTPGPDTVGISLLPWNFRESTALFPDPQWSFPTAFKNARGSKEYLTRLDAVCWTGGLGDKSSSLSGTQGVDWFAVKATGLNQTPYRPIPVYGQLDRSSGNTVYSCEWKFNTTGGKMIKEDAFPDVTITSSNVNNHISQGHIRSAWFTSGITNENDLQNPVDPVNLSALYSDWETYSTPGGTYDNTVGTVNTFLK